MTDDPVPFYRHGLGPADAGAVAEVLATPFLTSAGVGRGVEDILRGFFDVPHAKLTNSWTNGAVATLLALGIGPGDEVIVPAMTFIASANVVTLVGATPVVVDVAPDTLLIDPEAVAAALTPRTRAVMPVHLYGQMVDVPALRRVVGPEIAIVEDAAHCFEGTRDGLRPGAASEAAIFSFYATKNVTCGEGGAVITRSDALAEALAQTVLHGMSAGAEKRFEKSFYRHWDMTRLGTKANLPDILAALLPAQIARIDEIAAARQALAGRYRAGLSGVPGLGLVAQVPGGVSAEHLFPVHVPPALRDRVLHEMNAAGIGVTVNYRALHRMTHYRETFGFADDAFPVAGAWGDGTISLPLFPGLSETEQDRVIARLRAILETLDAGAAA